MYGKKEDEVMRQADLDAVDCAIDQALESIPTNLRGDRDLSYMRFEFRRLQFLMRRMNLVKNRERRVMKELSLRSKRAASN